MIFASVNSLQQHREQHLQQHSALNADVRTCVPSDSKAFSASPYFPSFMQHIANIYLLCADVQPACFHLVLTPAPCNLHATVEAKYHGRVKGCTPLKISYAGYALSHQKLHTPSKYALLCMDEACLSAMVLESLTVKSAGLLPRHQASSKRSSRKYVTSFGNSACRRSAMNLAFSIMYMARESTTWATSCASKAATFSTPAVILR
jgi:hypothetical protein